MFSVLFTLRATGTGPNRKAIFKPALDFWQEIGAWLRNPTTNRMRWALGK